jgi:hypothetical protein
MPDRDRSRGGRRARYCSGACKAKAYRDRQQAGVAMTAPIGSGSDPHFVIVSTPRSGGQEYPLAE